MLTREILKQVKQIEIRTRGVVNEVFSGEYHSVFKGRGMEFAEVREYMVGDDIRSIDWNVTARFGHPYVKVFEEERELTVMLLVDLSGSLVFGSVEKTKQRIAAELTSILAFSAMKNNDKVGLILFTDTIEKFVPPRKGRSHVLRIIRDVLSFEPRGNQTDLRSALEYFHHTIKKKSIAFLISDFIDKGYDRILNIAGRKHDLVGIALHDPRERDLPKAGLIKFRDAETGKIRFIDTSNKEVRDKFYSALSDNENYRKDLFLKAGLDSIKIDIGQSYVKPLVNFFKAREKKY
ncbi:MAG: DUF58 domain-containing protein [Ignavibacteriae bacterium HGW-Ignavibacteriae-2]|jgi:uncharacterized protein (DUF58 family)|nr:DUF58 domain-containing protein [Bacteroidota bacterium]PKL90313.1 MAG: DUF58 domain-containing protein [Ignavibacteriae bacterium HGW-Ignavibacteriae-2]